MGLLRSVLIRSLVPLLGTPHVWLIALLLLGHGIICVESFWEIRGGRETPRRIQRTHATVPTLKQGLYRCDKTCVDPLPLTRHYLDLSGTALLCQLLGMNCAAPTDFSFSFKGFACRGGGTDIHSDGWGIGFYEGRGLRCFHDPEPCNSSPIANLVANYPLRTLNMIAHIRYATAGRTCLENVHPFQREMVSSYVQYLNNVIVYIAMLLQYH